MSGTTLCQIERHGMEVRPPSALSPRRCLPQSEEAEPIRSTAGEAACMSFASLAAGLAPGLPPSSPGQTVRPRWREATRAPGPTRHTQYARPSTTRARIHPSIHPQFLIYFPVLLSLSPPSRPAPTWPGHLPPLSPSSRPVLPVDRHIPRPSPTRLAREGGHRRAAGIRGPGSYARMPAQKRQLPSPSSSSKPRDHVEANGADAPPSGGAGGGGGGLHPVPAGGAANRVADPQTQPQRAGDSGAMSGGAYSDSESSESDGDMDEFVLVKLAEVRKEVQCPICLGIIRKTRTVMECLHRFCRDCIDKSMRLGNNECPACRTHCASRRSLRDDPNYDALIATLYPDIDKYEEEELAFGEEERTRNKKIQATIEEMIRKQSEALGKKRPTAKATANAFARKYRRNVRTRGRGRTVARDIAPTGSDDEDREEENANVESKELPSPDNHSPDSRQKRGRKRPAPTPSPARTIGSSDHGSEENDEVVSLKEGFTTSPLRGEMLAWGKNGTRSQTRYNNVGGTNGRLGKGGRFAKFVDHLRATDENKEFNLYLVLLPLDGQTTPNLEKPYLSCRPRVSIRHLLQFIALQLSRQVEELEMYIRVDLHNRSVAVKDSGSAETELSLFDGLERLTEDKLLLDLHPSFASGNGDLELMYALKRQG
ncbi:hypothetical protein ACQJBY_028296 [Aegilops geniculata]